MAVVAVIAAALTLLAGGSRRPPKSDPPGGASAHPPGSTSSGPDGGAGTAAGPNPTVVSRTARACFAVGGVAFFLGHVGFLVGPRADPSRFIGESILWAVVFGLMAVGALDKKSRAGMTAVASLFMVVCYLVVPIIAVATAPPIDAPFPQVGNAVQPKQNTLPPNRGGNTSEKWYLRANKALANPRASDPRVPLTERLTGSDKTSWHEVCALAV